MSMMPIYRSILVVLFLFLSGCTIESELIVFNHTDELIWIRFEKNNETIIEEKVSPGNAKSISGWTYSRPSIQKGSVKYQYGAIEHFQEYRRSWRGWWIFAYSYFYLQIQPNGDLYVLEENVQPPTDDTENIQLIIKPKEKHDDV